MVPPDFYRLFWLGWLLAFAVIESYAIWKNVPGGTFSEWVWWILGSGDADREWYRNVFRVVVAGFLVWLIPHFFTRWKWW